MHRTKKQDHFWRKVKAFSEIASHITHEDRGEGKQLSSDGNALDFSASPSRVIVAIPKHLAGAVCFTEGKHSMNLKQIQI